MFIDKNLHSLFNRIRAIFIISLYRKMNEKLEKFIFIKIRISIFNV